MSIHNGIGITSYSRTMDARIEGTPAAIDLPKCRTYTNPLAKQVERFTVAGTASDGTYSITVVEPDGTQHTAAFVRGAAESNDAIGDALQAALQVLIGTTLAGVLESLADSGTATLDATFEHEGIAYTFILSAPGTGTLSSATITSPAGAALPFGRFIADGGAAGTGQRIPALPSGVAETAIRGFTMRPWGRYANLGSNLSTDNDSCPAGETLDVAFEGPVNVRNVGAAAVQNGSVFVVVNTAGGDALGEARGDDDGANSVELPARNAYWAEDVAAGAVGPVYLRL